MIILGPIKKIGKGRPRKDRKKRLSQKFGKVHQILNKKEKKIQEKIGREVKMTLIQKLRLKL